MFLSMFKEQALAFIISAFLSAEVFKNIYIFSRDEKQKEFSVFGSGLILSTPHLGIREN